MKKLVLFAAVAAFGFAMTSCKKDYVCTCDLGILGETSVEYNGLKKDEAETLQSSCESSGLCTWSEQ